MENLVYERDYSQVCKETSESNPFNDFLVQALTDGFLTSYTNALNAVPKVIIPEYQANYEYFYNSVTLWQKNGAAQSEAKSVISNGRPPLTWYYLM